MRIFILIIFLFPGLKMVAQHPSGLEEALFTCEKSACQSIPTDLEKIISGYEALLLEAGLLKDSSSVGYQALLTQSIADTTYSTLLVEPFSSFHPLKDLEKESLLALQDCLQSTLAIEAYAESDWHDIEKQLRNISQPDNAAVARILLHSLSLKDYKSLFYKEKIFFALDMLNPNTGARPLLPPIKPGG